MTGGATSGSGGVLQGIRVLDVADYLPAEYAARILADLGAEVVKVEPAPAGVRLRRSRLSHLFAYANAGKSSLCLNLEALDRAMVRDLANWADVVLGGATVQAHGHRPPLEDQLAAENGSLIVCALTPFGRGGPTLVSESEAAMDAVVQALAGTAYVTGEPEGPPYLNPSGMTHTTAALHACIGVIHALLNRRRTGKGQRIELSALDTAVAMDAEHAPLVATERGRYQAQRTGHHGDVDTQAVYRARGGYVVVEVWGEGAESVWGRLAQVIGRPDLIDDPRFRDDQGRMTHAAELHPIVENWVQSFESADEAVKELLKGRVVCGQVLLPWQAIDHPHVKSRRVVRSIEGQPDALLTVAAPQKFESGEVRIGAVPSLGQHNEHVLAKCLGYSSSRISELRRKNLLRSEAV